MRRKLQDGNVVVDLGLVALSDALGNPHDVTAFLFLEAEIGVEDSVVELLQKRVHVYRQDKQQEVLKMPDSVSCDEILPGFVLDLKTVWQES